MYLGRGDCKGKRHTAPHAEAPQGHRALPPVGSTV